MMQRQTHVRHGRTAPLRTQSVAVALQYTVAQDAPTIGTYSLDRFGVAAGATVKRGRTFIDRTQAEGK
jgi:hypothetical protein